jgi:hypothetical protein
MRLNQCQGRKGALRIGILTALFGHSIYPETYLKFYHAKNGNNKSVFFGYYPDFPSCEKIIEPRSD